MKIHSILILVILNALLIQSCSIDKRVHQKGYYISWNSKTVSVPNSQVINVNKEQIITEDQSLNEYTNADSVTLITAEDNLITSNELTTKEITKPSKKSKDITRQIDQRIRDHKRKDQISQTIHKAATIVKHLPTKSNSFDNTYKSKTPSVGLGLFLLGISMMIAFGFSMPIGIILGGLSVLLILAIIITKALSPKGYIDVIYFKNGNIIRGQIIEQIPNESLKIKTQDGSVYVHQFEEIEKIVSEEL